MGRRTRRRYTKEERGEAVALASRVGVRPAARALGLPKGTIANWVRKAPEVKPEEPVRVETTTRETETRSGRVAKHYTPSQRAQILEYAAANGVTAASKEHGVSRFSIYGWRRKVARAAAGQGDSPTSGPDPREVEAQRDREILDTWQRHPGLGPSQIKNQLRRRGIKVSTNTVRRVMEDAGYRPPKRKRSKHDQRFEAVRPNHLWHLDFLQRYINRASTFTLILLDDHSRFVVGHGVDDAERADLVLQTFEAAVERHGRPEMVVHDRGAAFWSWRGISRFTRLLEEMEIEQIPGTKQANGKLEVFNANLQKELFDAHRFYDLAEMKRRLAAHLRWYNLRRTSHALGGLLVPADRYYGRVEEVMARIEAGVTDDSDPLDLRSRILELFKVVSVDGRAEVWLMGQQLLLTR
ncbi:MAG: DDE-type integrase/transposase/recombinase [Deltaproteobacteria bacterium]|nr:DDE-type integrase/transposase/recombinase [Deltaproteobacteria bacterium]MBW2256259.1 DDE-type integrase/transposase/recombinase [Deltaproteobacteria bacterium]